MIIFAKSWPPFNLPLSSDFTQTSDLCWLHHSNVFPMCLSLSTLRNHCDLLCPRPSWRYVWHWFADFYQSRLASLKSVHWFAIVLVTTFISNQLPYSCVFASTVEPFDGRDRLSFVVWLIVVKSRVRMAQIWGLHACYHWINWLLVYVGFEYLVFWTKRGVSSWRVTQYRP